MINFYGFDFSQIQKLSCHSLILGPSCNNSQNTVLFDPTYITTLWSSKVFVGNEVKYFFIMGYRYAFMRDSLI